MAYGVNATVQILVGGLTEFITSDNIDTVITVTDSWVDDINSQASSTNKTLASNLLAADMLLNIQARSDAKGAMNLGGTQGNPQIAPPSQFVSNGTMNKVRKILRSRRPRTSNSESDEPYVVDT